MTYDPGPPPRAASFRAVFARAPQNLRFGVFLAPPGLVAGLTWLLVAPGKDAAIVFLAGLFATSFALWWWARVQRLVVHGVPVEGQVVRVSASDDLAFALSVEVHYAYWIGTRRHVGMVLSEDRSLRDLPAGTPLTVLVDPVRPGRSVPWDLAALTPVRASR
jgi:hypothetical protein